MNPQDAAERQLSVLDRLELGLLPDEGLAFDEALSEEWLQAEVLGQDPSGLTLKSNKPGRAEISVIPIGPVETRPPITVRGTIRASADTSCVRCLADVAVEVAAEVDVTLVFGASSETETQDPEDISVDALDEQTYGADGLELGTVVRESILLGFDMNPTCEDEAACDERTAAMLEKANRAAREADDAIDPRWAKLAAMKDEQ